MAKGERGPHKQQRNPAQSLAQSKQMDESRATGSAALLQQCSSGNSDSVHFGVVGEGRSQRILAYRSSGSLAQLSEEEESDWACEGCFYENGSDHNKMCAMCGGQRHSNLSSIMPIVEVGDEDGTAVNDNRSGARQAVPPSKKPPPTMSNRSTSMRQLLVKHLSSSGMQDAELTVKNPLQARSLEQKEKRDDLTTSLARMAINECGGWTCMTCTFVIIDLNFLTCEVCGAEKPPKEELAQMTNTSIRDFLANSVQNTVSTDASFMDPQIQAYLKFENTASRKEQMTSFMMQNSFVLEEASHRSSGDLSDGEMTELRGILNEGQATLKALKALYETEQTDYAAMDQLQMMRALEIEQGEGMAPQQVLSERATRPGVQRISREVLEWHGQQRMLDDWKMQLDIRLAQIEQLGKQQKQSLYRILGN
jgi:rubrerythrin